MAGLIKTSTDQVFLFPSEVRNCYTPNFGGGIGKCETVLNVSEKLVR